MSKRITETFIYIYLTVAVLFSSVQWSLMLVDGVSMKELTQCLDHRAQSLTNSSR